MLDGLIPEDYPDFEEHGAPPCSETFPDAFFTEERSTSDALRNGKVIELTHSSYTYGKEAKAVCAECPYKIRCLEYAIKYHEIGIWGGTTERERRAISRNRLINKPIKGKPKSE